MAHIIDGRGKIMVRGGRQATARHARFLRRLGAGGAIVRAYILSSRAAYVAECGPVECWTAGRQRHNRIVTA